MRRAVLGLSAAAFASLSVGASVPLASTASAGCMVNMLGAQYCDAPPRPDGTWQRCWATGQQFYPTFGAGGYQNGFGSVPAMGNCYDVNPAEPWPVVPIGQPQYYIQ
ncbi:hypothetical protein SBI67_16290 [Mycolicibacterium sp. 120266]|uniref:CDGP domain-containing protein n=1 Tax=Mycolicibacterium sp. 120266 TaxID=3090601 RepID=UPI00299E718E|nr:hypothetical protein [Mycolicibacterium sp. 120266]MDX1873679.1 hypothetical protein [Mycolicibacterium sp. 120266]